MKYNNTLYKECLGMSILKFAQKYDIPYETVIHHCKSGYCKLGKSMPNARKHRLYKCYRDMLSRCYNPKLKSYYRYGGRGIRVCPEWFYSFESFVKDMYPSYVEGLSLDRVDNNGDYSRCNCRWASTSLQNWNRENSKQLPGLSRTPSGGWITQLKHRKITYTTKTVHSREEALMEWWKLCKKLGKPIGSDFDTWLREAKLINY